MADIPNLQPPKKKLAAWGWDTLNIPETNMRLSSMADIQFEKNMETNWLQKDETHQTALPKVCVPFKT